MKDRFLSHVHRIHPQLLYGQTYLLALSGGVDSVVLGYLLRDIGVRFEVAHCNFHLRGADSDSDKAFVETLALQWNVKCHTVDFDTISHAKSNGISIEMAARELRYKWFAELIYKYHLAGVLVAQHANDQAETVLLNIARGSSLDGIAGMHPVNDTVLRPLLAFSRIEILDYAAQNNIEWVEDCTNTDQTITRNSIRHSIVPLMEGINPNFVHSLSRNTAYVQDALGLFYHLLDQKIEQITTIEQDKHKIDIQLLQGYHPHTRTLLYYLLRRYDLEDRTTDILDCIIKGQSGKVFVSSTYRLLRDRDFLLVESINLSQADRQRYIIQDTDSTLTEPIQLSMRTVPIEELNITSNTDTAYFDADKIVFPLILRHVEQGDSFCPYGMGGSVKKLSKYLKDNKVSAFDKEQIWLLCSPQKIAWVVGYRSSEDFKIDSNSQKALIITTKTNK